MKELNKIKVEDVKELTIKKLLENEDTSQLYNHYMGLVLDAANKGAMEIENGIWEAQGYSLNAKQSVVNIFKLKGFNVSPSCGVISWNSGSAFGSIDSSY